MEKFRVIPKKQTKKDKEMARTMGELLDYQWKQIGKYNDHWLDLFRYPSGYGFRRPWYKRFWNCLKYLLTE